MNTKLQPCGFKILIEPYNIKGKTDWGFDLSNTAEHQREVAATERGTIVAIGPTAWKAYDDGKPWAKVGDMVIFAKYGGKLVTHPDDPSVTYMLINDEDVQAIVEE